MDVVRARIEEQLGAAGIRLAEESEKGAAGDGSPLLRATVPFAGVDLEVALLGVPFVVPGLPVALGDVSLYRSSTLTGRARMELSLWAADGTLEETLPAAEASRYYRNVTVLTFVGPFRFTDLDQPPPPGSEP